MSKVPQRETLKEEPKRQFRYRNVVFTVNNWTGEMYTHICNCDADYIVIGKEVGAYGTPHLQGYAEWHGTKQLSWVQVQERLGGHAWFQARKGTPEQAANYCKEDGDFFERGRRNNPGAAAVIEDVKDQMIEGLKVNEIVLATPYLYHQYGRTMHKIESVLALQKFRTWRTVGVWFYGPTGTGKSYDALLGYTPDTHYIFPNDPNGWWDGYEGQEIVVFNDFRGEVKYNFLLQLLDCYPMTVPRRNLGPTPFLARTVYFTSSMHPRDMYAGLDDHKDGIDQLLRRIISIIHKTQPFLQNVSESSGVIVKPRDDSNRYLEWLEQQAVANRQRRGDVYRILGRSNRQLALPEIVADLSATHPARGLVLPDT